MVLSPCSSADARQKSPKTPMKDDDDWYDEDLHSKRTGSFPNEQQNAADSPAGFKLPAPTHVSLILTAKLSAIYQFRAQRQSSSTTSDDWSSLQVRVKTAAYVKSSVKLEQCPKLKLPEFAVIGRSNVGKSSLINMLTGQSSLAKVSKTPGKSMLLSTDNLLLAPACIIFCPESDHW